jgi:hypothetical protein
MMASEGGELTRIGRTPEVLAIIEKYGDKAMQFIWNHKGALAVAATLTAFLAEPEPFINGVKDITQAVAKPLAEVPAIAAREGTAEVARNTNWTIVFLAIIAALTLLARARRRLLPSAVVAVLTAGKRLLAHVASPATASPSPERKEEIRGRS